MRPRTEATKQQLAYYSLHRRYVALLYALQAAPLPSEDAKFYDRWYVEVRGPALIRAEHKGGRISEEAEDIGRMSLAGGADLR